MTEDGEINYGVKYALDPKPEGEGTGPLFICECGQRTRVATMGTPLVAVFCANCKRCAPSVPGGRWAFDG